MNINTYATYYPSELNKENLAAYQDNLRLWVQANSSEEIDTRPGSVVGDLVLGTESIINSALDQALTNFASDLDLANPAAGNIYNCDFVAKYIENFSTSTYTDITSSGTIRLVFSTPEFRLIDRGTQFRSNNQIFLPRGYKEGNIRVIPPGQTRSEKFNDFILTGLGSRFYVDIPVYSMDATAVSNLDEFEISELIPGLVEIYAVGDFWTLPSTSSIQDLANKTRTTSVSANASTRSGIVRLLRKEFPELTAVSPVIVGDFEMTRQGVNPLGLPTPSVDLYVKSPLYGSVLKEPVRLEYDDTNQAYFGELTLQNTVLKLNSIAFADQSDTTIDFNSYFLSTDPKLPALSAYGTSSNRVWVKIPVPRNASGVPILPPTLDLQTNSFYQIFEITYTTDPGLKLIEDFFMSPDYKPIGLDLKVKLFNPIDFTALYINHSRKRGVKLNKSKARDEILNYFRTVSWPDTYSDATIIDSMFYAGASNVFKVESDAFLLVGPCDYLIREVPSSIDYLMDENNIQEIPKFRITGSNNFSYAVKDYNTNFEDNMHYATGGRNISYLLNSDQILFREVGNNVL